MAITTITKVGAFTNDVAKQINDNFAEVSSGGTFASPTITGTVAGAATYTNPTFTTPTLGVAAATSVNKVAITAPAASATLTIANTKTLTVSNSLTLAGTDATVMTFPAASASILAGVGLYKVARGINTQVAASDTVVTGLATVVACVVSFQSAPTVKQLWCAGDIGNQSGSPAAGSILIKTYKPTAVDNCTPTAATDFTDNLAIAWTAIGT